MIYDKFQSISDEQILLHRNVEVCFIATIIAHILATINLKHNLQGHSGAQRNKSGLLLSTPQPLNLCFVLLYLLLLCFILA